MAIRFSFDLGTNSIGWAAWRTGIDPSGVFGNDAPVELLRAGVRIFKDGRNPKSKASLASERRAARLARRTRDRFKLRRDDLLKALAKHGLFPEAGDDRLALAKLDPYHLRARAVAEALEPHEIGRALFHLHQRRGFKSMRKGAAPEDDLGKIAAGTERLKIALAALGCRTLGEFLWQRRGERKATRIRLDGTGNQALYEFCPTREIVHDEFHAIWTAQAVHHSGLMTDVAKSEIETILFRQRPIKAPPVGKCSFTEELRAPKALPSVAAREIYERLNHLRVGYEDGIRRPLTVPERDVLASELLRSAKLTFPKARKLLGMRAGLAFSLEEAGEKHIAGFKFAECLHRETGFGDRWDALSWDEKDGVVQIVIDEDEDLGATQRLVSEFSVPEADAAKLASLLRVLPAGYSKLGLTANSAILQALVSEVSADGNVITYADAVLRAGRSNGYDWHHSDQARRSGRPALDVPREIPNYAVILPDQVMPAMPGEEFGRFTNPTVHIGLNQLRKVVNELLVEFGNPAQIVVELARDIKQTEKQKKATLASNRSNAKQNDKRRELLQSLGVRANGDSMLKLRLLDEQAGTDGRALCPFSGREITHALLFHSSEIEVEHLLPMSRTLDDTAANKVLCYRDKNREKRGRTPFEAFGDRAEWPEIWARAKSLPGNKSWRFKPDAMERYEKSEGFLGRHLGETRYLSRVAQQYLQAICVRFDGATGERVYGDVFVTPGEMTALLRSRWRLNEILGDTGSKNRDDHRHHAIDAIVIGAMTRGWLSHLAYEAGRYEGGERADLVKAVAEPFPGFRDAVKAAVDRVVVSYKPEHGIEGALFKETAYGLVPEKHTDHRAGNVVYRKPLVSMSVKEVAKIRGYELRTGAMASIDGVAPDNKALVAARLQRFGEEQGVRRARLLGVENAVVSKTDAHGREFTALKRDGIHHMDIVKLRDGSWKMFAAPITDVNRKGFRPIWEVQKVGGKLAMRLHKGDMIELDGADGREVKVVIKFSESGQVVVADHNAGGNLKARDADKKDPFRYQSASADKLRGLNAIALKVSPSGVMHPRRIDAGKI